MYGYEIYKRNKCLITIGDTPSAGLPMINKNASKEHKQEVKEAPYEHGSVSVPCYFLKPPSFNFSSEFSEANDLVSNMLGGVGDALYTANLALPALDALDGNMDEAMSATEAGYNSLRQSYKGQGGLSKEQFNADKRKAVMNVLDKLGGIVKEVGSRETKTFRVGKVLDWKGSNPVEFSLEVLFAKPNDGVYMGTLYPLIEAASFSQIAFGNYLYGPRGYNSAGFGIGAIERILNGEFKSLHSLRLWYDASDEFGTSKSTHTIVDLFRLLVITNVQINKSEQLFFNPSRPDSAPLYKYIQATISFKTACPVPGSLFAKGQGMREDGANASLHDFYGPMSAPFLDSYPKPLTDKGLDAKQVPGLKDMRRLLDTN